MYVIGGLVGWFSGNDGFNNVEIHPHELVGGEWVWLIVLPLLLAAMAPFTVRWLSFLWLTPVPALVFTVGSMVYKKDIILPLPYRFLQIEETHWGLVVSLVGAALAALALACALMVVIMDRKKASALGLRQRLSRMKRSQRRLTLALTLIVVGGLGGLVITIAYDPEARRIEKRLGELVRRSESTYQADRLLTRVNVRRTHCERIDSGQWWCTYSVEYDNDSTVGASLTTDGSTRDLKRVMKELAGARDADKREGDEDILDYYRARKDRRDSRKSTD